MLERLSQYVPAEGLKILIVLFLSFLIGLEREEHKAESEHYSFGGVRTVSRRRSFLLSSTASA